MMGGVVVGIKIFLKILEFIETNALRYFGERWKIWFVIIIILAHDIYIYNPNNVGNDDWNVNDINKKSKESKYAKWDEIHDEIKNSIILLSTDIINSKESVIDCLFSDQCENYYKHYNKIRLDIWMVSYNLVAIPFEIIKILLDSHAGENNVNVEKNTLFALHIFNWHIGYPLDICVSTLRNIYFGVMGNISFGTMFHNIANNITLITIQQTNNSLSSLCNVVNSTESINNQTLILYNICRTLNDTGFLKIETTLNNIRDILLFDNETGSSLNKLLDICYELKYLLNKVLDIVIEIIYRITNNFFIYLRITLFDSSCFHTEYPNNIIFPDNHKQKNF